MLKYSNNSVFSLRKKRIVNKYPLITKESFSGKDEKDNKTILNSYNISQEKGILYQQYKNTKHPKRNTKIRTEQCNSKVQKSYSSRCIFVSTFKTPSIYKFHSNLLKMNKKKFEKNNSMKLKLFKRLNNSDVPNYVLSSNITDEYDKNEKPFIIKKTEEKKFNKRFLSKNTKGEEKVLIINEIRRLQQKPYLHTNNSCTTLPKLKRKSISQPNNSKQLVQKQINKISYIKVQNPFFELNREGKIPVLMDDGHCLLSLLNDSFRYLHTKK